MICDMAEVYDMGAQIHVCGGPIATAAALQLEAAIPNFTIHEHHCFALTNACIRSCEYDYQPVNGCYEIPELPGIGQELSEYEYARARKTVVDETNTDYSM